MRKQFVKTVEDILKTDPRLVLLLGDISVFGFRNAFKEHPDRVYNIGILEQSTVSLAAGLSLHDMIPVVHTIAPFIVERSLEQIKDDFGYQNIGGNFIGIGGSYDYAVMGGTHHCPGDVGILKNVPNMEIVVPGTPAEFDSLFRATYADGKPTYFRLSERSNKESFPVEFGKAMIVQKGLKATVVTVGPMLESVREACKGLDVTILYYTTVAPFDRDALATNIAGDKVIVCEPFYEGSLDWDIAKSAEMAKKSPSVHHIGVPREFIHKYGNVGDIDAYLKLTAADIRERIEKII
ncbi:MAG TPA: hypothetical protein VHE10_00650 [Candidatus Paceibacterota bacterium]|nr:hypothetical protein [Candidatus Paceibacterota bacterium]